MSETKSVHTEGADIVYDIEGTGPLLVTIAGAGGEADKFTGISALLKDEYRVIRYDRRCCSRSTGDATQDFNHAQQARDIVAIIRNEGESKAFLMGSSGGGSIACQFAEDFPEMVLGAIVHEPATQATLPDAAEVLAFCDRVEATRDAEGVVPALKLFASSLVGIGNPATMPGAAQGRLPFGNLDYFMHHEFHIIGRSYPDMPKLKASGVKLMAIAGAASAEAFYARTARLLAERTGCPFHLVSGNHLSYQIDPATFAKELRPLLQELKTPAPAA